MSIPANVNPLLLAADAATPSGFQVSRSLRFDSSSTSYLSRTPSVASNKKTWTWSGWVKRSVLDSATFDTFFACRIDGSNYTGLIGYRNSANDIGLVDYSGGVSRISVVTTQVFRDTSAWFHLLCAVDTTAATSTDRVKIYVNGVLVTALSSSTYPSQNIDTNINTTNSHRIGEYAGYYSNSYLSNVQFIDGQALTPSSFTEVSATTGQLIPKAYSGTYGTNGFYLKFADNSTTAALGTDSSGNGNTWTTNNFSVTAGAGNDSLVDTPTSIPGTNTGVGGEIRGNYATLNPLDKSSSFTLLNGNLDATTSGGYYHSYATIFPASGKYYFEMLLSRRGGNGGIALANILSTSSDLSATKITLNGWSGGYQVYVDSSNNNVSGFTSANAGDILKLAYDAGTGEVWLGVNEYWITSSYARQTSFPSTATGTVTTPVKVQAVFNNIDGSFNFGQRAWAYTAPTNYQPIVDTSLPTPVVAKPNTLMDVKLWTGDGSSTRAITGLEFNPDFVWIKNRNQAGVYHNLFDKVRDSGKTLFSNTTDSEVTNSAYGYLSSFDSNGFSLSAGGSGSDNVNVNNWTYAAWCWDAGTSTVSNTQGSITSSVRANASAGFSIVSYTAPSSVSTVGHGLNVTPQFIISKNRTSAGNWAIYHASQGAGYYFEFSTQAAISSSGPYNSTAPTSSVFTIGTNSWWGSGGMISYCFAPVVGYSSFGSYVGSGTSDGPFVYTGFRPRFVLAKRTDNTGDWFIWDAARVPYNQNASILWANSSNAETTSSSYGIDLLSNGFKLTGGSSNSNFGTLVYAAFAEAPFQYARAR